MLAPGSSFADCLLRRYVHGPADDEPLVWYEGSGTTDRRFLHSDERGSVIATSNSSGATLSTNAYDESGIPKSTNSGRFRYTGQTWLPELGMYYYKARIYSPSLGRFLQTDPIGYGDGMNLYAYVGGDPVNSTDPSGLCGVGQIEVARYRTSRPDGDVVALYRLFCQRLYVDDNDDGGRGESSEGTASSDTQPLCLVDPPAISPSAATTSRAVNSALREIYGSKTGPMTNPMNRDFAQLPAMPDFSRPGWQTSWSRHSGYAWETSILSMAGYVVKVYVNDRDAGGTISATITSATRSPDHIFAYVVNVATGYVGNADNAVNYLSRKQPCR